MADILTELVAKITVDTKALQPALKNVEGQMGRVSDFFDKHSRKIAVGITGAIGAAGAFAAASVKMYTNLGSEIHEMSIRTGLGAESLSELRYAAEQSGASLGGLQVGIRTMAGAITDASEGMETYQRAFGRIGIQVEELIGLKPEEQFMKIATGIASLEDSTLRAATAQDIFGRSGTQLLPLFAEGADGIAKLRQEAHDLGITFTDTTAARAEQLGDTLTRFNEQIKGIQFTIAEGLLPNLEWWSESLTRNDSQLKLWIKTALDWGWVADEAAAREKAWGNVMNERSKFLQGLDNEYVKSLGILESVLKAQGKLNEESAKSINSMRGEADAHQKVTEIIEQKISAIAYSKEVIDGVIVTTNLFTEAEVEAANAAGLLIENVPTAADKVREFEKAMEDAQRATKKATEEIEATNKQFEEMIDRVRYTGTEADKFGITMFDIYDAMNTLGYSVDDIRWKWDLWGNEIGSVEIALKSLGLTAKEIDKLLNGTTLRAVDFTGVDRETQADYEAYLRATQKSFERTGDPMFERAHDRALEEGPLLFQHGGIVTRPTLGIVGEKGPEAVIPLDRLNNQMMTIIIELDGRELSKAVMPYATQEIRARTGIR